jgi:acetyl-CoA synthetase
LLTKNTKRLEFFLLPKTISGKIRRVELKDRDAAIHAGGDEDKRASGSEYWESDFQWEGSA